MTELPANGLGHVRRCCAHQSHRIIASREARLIGDLHSIHLTCSNYRNQSKLQLSLRQLLEGMTYIVGVAPPDGIRLRNERIMRATIFRSGGWPSDAANLFLSVWNGDWSKAKPEHYSEDGALSPEQALDRMYEAALGIDLLVSSEQDLPSADNWGSFGKSVAVISLGCCAHNILGQALRCALPSWDSMLHNESNPNLEEGAASQPLI